MISPTQKVKQRKICFDLKHFNHIDVACEQALGGALAAGRDKEGELATTSLEFDYLHRKSRCEMLIGGDDIRNEALPLARVFQCLFPLRADWRRSDSSVDGESGNHKGIGGGIQIPEA